MSEDKDSFEMLYAFLKAEISLHPEFGFLTLCLFRWEMQDDGQPRIVPGLRHQLRPEQVEDLINYLRHALDAYRKATELGGNEFPRH